MKVTAEKRYSKSARNFRLFAPIDFLLNFIHPHYIDSRNKNQTNDSTSHAVCLQNTRTPFAACKWCELWIRSINNNQYTNIRPHNHSLRCDCCYYNEFEYDHHRHHHQHTDTHFFFFFLTFCVNWYTSMCVHGMRAAHTGTGMVQSRARYVNISKWQYAAIACIGWREIDDWIVVQPNFFAFHQRRAVLFHFFISTNSRILLYIVPECRPHIYNMKWKKKNSSGCSNNKMPK